ncbi:hypothetical protein [Fodinibius sediminis]|uniref:Uncharacterized protein n=1 Tax=Fodinibius sediminis TaxID=1214077 RepID=A0A521F8B5_9BACT|nr:hypothetical protein [Fodinibius sediminis]SMO92449.1 hypothetical protein SAMN06265218_1262 [Fodinibius sediminis]
MEKSNDSEMLTSRTRAYQCILNVRLIYRQLSKKRADIFVDAMNNNPLKKIILQEEFQLDQIKNFHRKQYYELTTSPDDQQSNPAKKKDILKLRKNIKASYINDLWRESQL